MRVTLRKFLYALGMLAVLVAIFRLPFAFPPHPNASLSYLVGFNNHVSMLTLLVGSLLFALVSGGAGLHLSAASSSQSIPFSRQRNSWVLVAAIALTTVLLALFWYRMRGDLTPATGEAAFFMDRYHELLRGGRIYHDFTFDYGPLLFFPPVWLYRVTGMAFIDAYFTMLLLQWCAGLAALWFVLQRVASSHTGRLLTFLVITLAWLTSIGDMGFNYTPLRFVGGSLAAVLVYGLYQRGQRGLTLCLTGVVSFAVLFFYSPEQGLAFLIATVLFFAICVRDRRVVVALVAFVVGCAGIIAIGKRAGILRSLMAFGGGNYDFPVLPSKQSVFLLLALICAACLVVNCFRVKDTARVELYLVCLGVAGCPAAFGRADPGHIFVNTSPALLVALMALFQSGTAVMLFTVAASCLYIGTSYKAHSLRMWDAVRKVRDEGKNGRYQETIAATSRLVGTQEVLAPFAFPITGHLLRQSTIHSGQFFGFIMPNPQLAALKISELESNPTISILVPKDFELSCERVTPSDANVMLQTILATPFVPPVKHSVDVGSSMCEYVRTHYVVMPGLPADSKYQMMRPRLSPGPHD